MLDKEKLKSIAEELGLEIGFGDNPGFHYEDGTVYTFESVAEDLISDTEGKINSSVLNVYVNIKETERNKSPKSMAFNDKRVDLPKKSDDSTFIGSAA